jgi:hypothetical protein
MKKKKPKKAKKRKTAAKSSRRRRAARVRPIVGPFQIELPLQMPLFPLLSSSPSEQAAPAPVEEAAPADAAGSVDET